MPDPDPFANLRDACAAAEAAADALGLSFAAAAYRFNSENGGLVLESLHLNAHAAADLDRAAVQLRDMLSSD